MNDASTEWNIERSSEDGATPEMGEKLVVGAKGGLVATVVMTAFRLPISRSLPPTDEFWARYVRSKEGGSHLVPALLLHLLYGIAAGVVYAVGIPGPSKSSEVEREVSGVITAVAFSLVLSAFGLRIVLGELLGQELRSDERFVFHLGHVVYGITLGAWIGSRST